MTSSVQYACANDMENGFYQGGNGLEGSNQMNKLETAEEAQPRLTFVDPAGDRYDPKTKLE